MQVQSHKPRRTAIACIACRQSKVKCSGDEPCANCIRRSLTCQFSEANSKVLVSERSKPTTGNVLPESSARGTRHSRLGMELTRRVPSMMTRSQQKW
ncbi:hypothetical protein BDV34DRAFT_180103 [Aspergillus parasiticus]|uniref:Zn(2)-C6 fungal-type domain-containing protein n=1 Tax=Aspergillus parasiticus TaxID=5067 RepID=A0A5N6D6Y0_ASPPA|nr:hypothetical protein BDV34DRAFT_180103 [Aspergillus parasiticus]